METVIKCLTEKGLIDTLEFCYLDNYGCYNVPKKYKRGTPVVYFLFDEGKLIYIGSTMNIKHRHNEHRYQKQFDAIGIITTPLYRQIEIELICELKPKFNKSKTPYTFIPDRYISPYKSV